MVQSSSVVGLMVLAFVGAGLMSLQNALGVVFGSNLGTTFTGWLVATLGFKLDIQALSLPLIATGSLALLVARGRGAELGRIALGIGLLLLGLDFMKQSVDAFREGVNPETMVGLKPWQYLLFGVVFAGVVQSSSATMVVALAALDSGLISLPAAAAVAIGADLGTTTTVILGSIQGATAKRRVALAHFLFNLVTDTIAFALLLPLLSLVAAAGIADPLLSLVAFHSLFNLLGLILFLPLTGLMATQLNRLFVTAPTQEAKYVSEVSPEISEAAMAAMEEETARLIYSVTRQNMRVFRPPLPLPPGLPPVQSPEMETEDRRSFDEMYRWSKRLEGEILAFATRLQSQPMEEHESQRLTQLLSAIRDAVHSSKQLKDIHHNLEDFRDSPLVSVNTYLQHVHSVMSAFFGDLYQLRQAREQAVLFEDLVDLFQRARQRHDQLHHDIIEDVRSVQIPDEIISSLLNVNRELLNSNLSLLMALSYFHLDPEQADAIARMPGVS